MEKIEVTNDNIIEIVQASRSNVFETFNIEVYWDELTKKNRKFIESMKGDFKIITTDKRKVPINLHKKVKIENLRDDLNKKAIKLLQEDENRIKVYNMLVKSQISPFLISAIARNHSIYNHDIIEKIAKFIPYLFQCNTQYFYGFLAMKIQPEKNYKVYIKNNKKVKDKSIENIIIKLKNEYNISKREIEHIWPYFIMWCQNGFIPEIDLTKKECEYLNIKYETKKEKKIEKNKKVKSLLDF